MSIINPKIENLLPYLHQQFPATKGHVPLTNFINCLIEANRKLSKPIQDVKLAGQFGMLSYRELEAKNNDLTESNRQLREELEKVKTNLHVVEMAKTLNGNEWQRRVSIQNEALAAAKEALEKDWDALTEFGQISDETRVGLAIKSNRDALARIAECEKMG